MLATVDGEKENSLPSEASRVDRILLAVVVGGGGVVNGCFGFSELLFSAGTAEFARVTCLAVTDAALDDRVTGGAGVVLVVVLVVVVVVMICFGGNLQQLRTKYPLTQTPIGWPRPLMHSNENMQVPFMPFWPGHGEFRSLGLMRMRRFKDGSNACRVAPVGERGEEECGELQW